MQPQWAYDPKRKSVFDLSKRDDLGLPAIVAVSVEPEEGRMIEMAPEMLELLREVGAARIALGELSSPSWIGRAAREILAHIEGANP